MMKTAIVAAVEILLAVVLAHAGQTTMVTAAHPDNTWVKQTPRPGLPSPQFGWEGSGAYDPYLRKWIHWGGHDGIPQGFHLFLWDPMLGTWEQKFPNTSPPGVCCVDGAETFDLANRRFVRFPGASLNHGWQWSRKVRLQNSAVWLYDAVTNTWSNMRPPPYKESVLAPDKIEVTWNPHPAEDLAGYNVYLGRAAVATNTALAKSWALNDPPYAEPVVDGVRDITNIQKLNDQPLTMTRFTDDRINLNHQGPESGDYKYTVLAYIVRAVNKLGTESGQRDSATIECPTAFNRM